MAPEADLTANRAAEMVARRSYGKLVAFLAARTRDVAGAEDALSDALAAALTEWRDGRVPDRPEAWLLTVARRKIVDRARRRSTEACNADLLRSVARELGSAPDQDPEIPDERLRLMFVCAHPAIDRTLRAPLILQTILGFDAAAIASFFLVSPAAMGQRLVRAKTKIRQAGISFQFPAADDLAERLDGVLEAIYAAFSAGWAEPDGTSPRHRDLAGEAIWLGRLVASLMPEEAESVGLLALMLHAEARRGARRNGQGEYVPLAEQDTRLWDDALIDEAEALLGRAGALGSVGRYQLEAAIQSAHAVRRYGGASDWTAIARLYDGLAAITLSPVVAINRAVVIAEVAGPLSGLAALQLVGGEGRLAGYQPYWAARAELLARAGDGAAADQAFRRAIGLETDPAVRRFLERRRQSIERPAGFP
jgi:RNA polymerase sigma-70 factor (ECF subfamily)